MAKVELCSRVQVKAHHCEGVTLLRDKKRRSSDTSVDVFEIRIRHRHNVLTDG